MAAIPRSAKVYVYGSAYSGIRVCIRIIAQQIPGLLGALYLDFQDIPGPNSFPRTFPIREILQTQFREFPGCVGITQLLGTLYRYQVKLEPGPASRHDDSAEDEIDSSP